YFRMDEQNMTMEEYIKLEEEKARRRGRVFNWKTATYGKIRVDDDLYDLRSMEAEFPTIVIDDAFTPHDVLPCKSQVSTPVNDEIDFRISFDESDDEDYTIICDKNLFSYKMISVNNLKTDSKNDNEKVILSIPSPEPTTSYIDDLDFFNDFENEFPAIVYNDAQTFKSDLLTEPILSPQHIDEFNLNDETSVSEYDKDEQNILYFNDLFPFNIIRPDDLKSEKDNNDNDIDIIQSSEDMAPLPPREQRYPFLRVQVVDFQGMPELVRDCLFARMVMKHRDDAGVVVFTSRAWGRLFDTWGPLVRELILEFFSTLRFGEVLLDLDAPALGLHTEEEMESPSFARYWSESKKMILGKGDLHDYWRSISTDGDFLGPPPSYTLIRDLVLRLSHRMMAHSIAGRSQALEKVTVTDLFYLRGLDVGSVNIPYLLARYLRRFAAGRKSGAHISGGQFVARLAEHFGLLTAKILGGLTVIAPELPIIDMGELVRLQIYMEVDDTWAWVAMGPERQPDAATGAPRVAQDAPIVDEGGQDDPAPIHAPPPPTAARTMPQRMARLDEDVHKIYGALTEQREVIDTMARDFSKFSTWAVTSLARMMDMAKVTYVPYSETYVPYQRCRVRQRTGEASTSAAQQDLQQLDP
ncbi:hypothetical protein Tco_0828623, partial [Tanacetum coccineum]